MVSLHLKTQSFKKKGRKKKRKTTHIIWIWLDVDLPYQPLLISYNYMGNNCIFSFLFSYLNHYGLISSYSKIHILKATTNHLTISPVKRLLLLAVGVFIRQCDCPFNHSWSRRHRICESRDNTQWMVHINASSSNLYHMKWNGNPPPLDSPYISKALCIWNGSPSNLKSSFCFVTLPCVPLPFFSWNQISLEQIRDEGTQDLRLFP